jgi:DNA-binding MarR family transcriptional regulator
MKNRWGKSFGFLMGYCDHQVHKLMNKELQAYDVSPMQCRVLMYLYLHDGELDQKDLRNTLMVKASTVNGIVDRLEQKGMITRTTKPEDARVKVLRLTEKGYQFRDTFVSVEKKLYEQMERGFSPEEIAELCRLLQHVAQNLETEDTEC